VARTRNTVVKACKNNKAAKFTHSTYLLMLTYIITKQFCIFILLFFIKIEYQITDNRAIKKYEVLVCKGPTVFSLHFDSWDNF